MAICSANLLICSLVACVPVFATGDEQRQFINVEVRGVLTTGVVVVGNETTGVTITVKRQGAEDVTWELDLHGDPALEKEAQKLSGKLGLARGEYVLKHGVEVKVRHIVKVSSLRPG